MGNTTSLVLGFPIRRSSDQSSVGSSPRLIAASYVLLRLLVPRHSPCALKNLANKIAKTSPTRKRARLCLDARNHYSEVKVHTPPPSRVTTQHNVLPQDPTVCQRFNSYDSPTFCRLPIHGVDRIYKTYSPSRYPLQMPTLCSLVHSTGKWCSLERR